jgi:hypothetical protein
MMEKKMLDFIFKLFRKEEHPLTVREQRFQDTLDELDRLIEKMVTATKNLDK